MHSRSSRLALFVAVSPRMPRRNLALCLYRSKCKEKRVFLLSRGKRRLDLLQRLRFRRQRRALFVPSPSLSCFLFEKNEKTRTSNSFFSCPKMKAMEVPVYRPTLKEMEAGLEAYVHRIEREGGRFATAGLAKIIPPAGWTPRRAGYNNRWDVTIGRPIK